MILRFPGGKANLLPSLRPYLDRLVDGHGAFHDVFVGSGAMLLDVARRHPDLRLHANDADAGLMTFWNIVSGKAVEAFCERVVSTRPTLNLYREMLASRPRKPEDIAFRYYFLNRTSFSGLFRQAAHSGIITTAHRIAYSWSGISGAWPPWSPNRRSKYCTRSGAHGHAAARKQLRCNRTSAMSWRFQSTSIRGTSWIASIRSLIILIGVAGLRVWLRQKMQAHDTVSLPARRICSGARLMAFGAHTFPPNRQARCPGRRPSAYGGRK